MFPLFDTRYDLIGNCPRGIVVAIKHLNSMENQDVDRVDNMVFDLFCSLIYYTVNFGRH